MPAPYRILISKCVAADLEQIFDHIAKDSTRNAADMVERILAAIESLDTFPHRNVLAGRSSKARMPVRSLPVKPYLIFFRVDESRSAVRILRVRHGARRRPGRF